MKLSTRKVILWSFAALIIGVAGLGTAIFFMPGGCALTKERCVESDLKSFDSALAMYKLNAGSYPTTIQGLDSLCVKPLLGPPPRRWSRIIDKVQADPWEHPYVYRFPGAADPSEPELFSMGRDGIPGTADDIHGQ